MHDNSAKMEVPFEVLIQGPSGSRFVRSLLPFESIKESSDPKKRSTISIFHPDETNEMYGFAGMEADHKASKRQTNSETPAKIVAEANDDAIKTVESSSTEGSNVSVAEIEVKTDATEAAPESSTLESTSAAAIADHKVKRDTASDVPSENIAEIEAKAEAGESVDANGDAATTEPTVGLGLPILSPLLALKTLPLGIKAVNLEALKAQLKVQKGNLTNFRRFPFTI